MDLVYLRSNDLLVANLEGPVAEKQISTTKSIAFRFQPDVVPLLARYFFDAVSLANNHALDMGAQGLEDSFRLLPEGGIAAFGYPKSAVDERSVLLREINGQKIALIGLNDTDFKIKTEEVTAKISELHAAGYHVIPYIHWGTEYVHQPGQVQVEMARAFIDAGAMAVIGMHPHVVQSIEIYNNAPIFYSLGNAIFDQYFSVDTQEGLSLSLRLTPESATWYLLPLKIERSQFRLMTPEEKQPFLEKLAGWGGDDQEIKEQIVKGKIVINFTND
jgi:poly-gamma-glutamate synthesis protein (capsule biosynthesis protein)